jgi:hypothetical protein
VTVADSGALRVRRSRAHKAGDHSLCRGNCAALSLAAPPAPCAEVTDARAEMRQLAARMAEAHRADPGNAILGAELRKTLLELMPKGKQDADADLTGLFGALQA